MLSLQGTWIPDNLLTHSISNWPQSHLPFSTRLPKKHSTTTNLLSSLRDWTISLSNHKSTHICYIDFQRAFDTISHTKLIQKLTSYGVSGNLLFWIKSFLTNRYQCVRINSSQSSNLPVISGIPQGSVLGPILFNIFINDISDNFSDDVRTQLFADDLKLYTDLDLTHTPNTLQIHLDHIQTWSAKWQLYISNNKCFHFTIGHENHPNTLILSNSIVPHCSSIKDLGVILDSSLKYKSHIMDISARAKQRAALIHRCFASRSIKNLTRAYTTYIRPMLEYATTVWSPSQIYLINTIESVQKQFTKRFPGLKNLTYEERLKLLGLQSLEHRRLIFDLVLCYNIIHGHSAIPLDQMFSLNKNTTLRGHPLKITQPLPKNNTVKSFFAYRVIAPWNSLKQHCHGNQCQNVQKPVKSNR